MVRDGTARIAKTRAQQGYSQHPCLRYEGAEVVLNAVMEYYLRTYVVTGFRSEDAHDFCERFRALTGFSFDFRYPLEQWVYRCLRAPYFYNRDESGDSWNEDWVINPEEAHDFIAEDFFRLACYVAICHIKYGASYESITTNRIFDIITALGSDLPAQLKKHGSGTLPKDVTEYTDAELSCKANDAFATVKITLKTEREENYAQVLDFLCRLLEAEFPRSYTIDFRSQEKNFLTIKGLPKKGVHSLFANAVSYPALWPKIERYARLAIRQYEWYTNLENENCAMPGTFAVFALGMADAKYTPLLLHYLGNCDDEHSSTQETYLITSIEKYGFTPDTLRVFAWGADSMQELKSNKVFREKADSPEALATLADAREKLADIMRDDSEEAEAAGAGGPEADKATASDLNYVWNAVVRAIWGREVLITGGAKLIKAASADRKPFYERIFAK
jgi:hypothetical protein